jgi:hypothetical protein
MLDSSLGGRIDGRFEGAMAPALTAVDVLFLGVYWAS